MKKLIILTTILIFIFFSNMVFADIITPKCSYCEKCPKSGYKIHNLNKNNYYTLWLPIMILLNFLLIVLIFKLNKKWNIDLSIKNEIWKK